MTDSLPTQAIKAIVARINDNAPTPNYCRVYDGSFRKDTGADLLIIGSDRVDEGLFPLDGHRAWFVLGLRTASKNSRTDVVLKALDNHIDFVLRPMIDWVPNLEGVADLKIISTRQLDVEQGTKSLAYITTEIAVNILLQPINLEN